MENDVWRNDRSVPLSIDNCGLPLWKQYLTGTPQKKHTVYLDDGN